MEEHTTDSGLSYGGLALVLLGLLLLTALTIAASRFNTGFFKVEAALAIATAKACLVLFFFMRLGRAGRAVARTFVITIAVLALFIGLIFFDVAYRY
jgi:cytochrome c oxidase subunit IV